MTQELNIPKPPIKGREFAKYWNQFAPMLLTRANYTDAHLKNLEILCRLYTEYDQLTEIIHKEGYTYSSDGRYGLQIRTRPEVTERKNTMIEIRQYTRLLGIVLVKDDSVNSDEDGFEWKD